MKQETIHLLKNRVFFQNWSENDLELLLPFVTIVSADSKELIIHEGGLDHDLYIILSGSVQLEKNKVDGKQTFGILSKENLIGEMSFVDNKPRFCDAVCTEPVKAIKISADIREKEPKLCNQLYKNILIHGQERLRDTNKGYLTSLANEVTLLRNVVAFSHTLIAISVLLLISLSVNKYLSINLNIDPLSPHFAMIYLLLLSLPLIGLQFITGIGFNEIGLTFKNSTKPFIITFILLMLITVVLYVLVAIIHQKLFVHPSEFFNFKRLLPSVFFSYLIMSFTQEYVRCFLQYTVYQIYYTHKAAYSILISAVGFAFLHIHIGFIPVFIMFFAGLLFGIYYHFQRNIFAISLLHGIAGNILFLFNIVPSH